MITGARPLSRMPNNLDDAFYAASCFAGSADDSCCTILATRLGDDELYWVVDGDVGPLRDNEAGLDWWPQYTVYRKRCDG
jgi:hypothetical protein